MGKIKLLVILGPTAAGKTELSIRLAKRLNGEIICADSMQIYRELRIGTARPTEEEMQGIPHHLFGFLNPDQSYSVADYQTDARRVIGEIVQRRKMPILVGGTGLYIQALTGDLDFAQAKPDLLLRAQLSQEYEDKGGLFMHQRLAELDPKAAERIHPNDKKRLIRRLEILKEFQKEDEYNFRRTGGEFDSLKIGIGKEREQLYRDINLRVDQMFACGLEGEVRGIWQKYGSGIQAFSAIGYKEFLPYFKKEVDINEVICKIKQNTRHFAKRQLTWYRRDEQIHWRYWENYNSIYEIEDNMMQLAGEWMRNGTED